MVANHPLSPGGETHVVFDANVLLPPRLSDILFDSFLEGLFWARWSAEIEAEFLRNWPRVVTGTTNNSSTKYVAELAKAQQRLLSYKRAVRGHEIIGHGSPAVIAKVPATVHANDKHVAAAAIALADSALQYSANDKTYLLTSNLKHLGVAEMAQLGVMVVAPGPFIDSLTQADSFRVGLALERSVRSLINPPYTRERLVAALQIHGANATARHFALAWGLKP